MDCKIVMLYFLLSQAMSLGCLLKVPIKEYQLERRLERSYLKRVVKDGKKPHQRFPHKAKPSGS